jgi:hypothetical protein
MASTGRTSPNFPVKAHIQCVTDDSTWCAAHIQDLTHTAILCVSAVNTVGARLSDVLEFYDSLLGREVTVAHSEDGRNGAHRAVGRSCRGLVFNTRSV